MCASKGGRSLVMISGACHSLSIFVTRGKSGTKHGFTEADFLVILFVLDDTYRMIRGVGRIVSDSTLTTSVHT